LATIFIIAGPPGIGKSTSGNHFIPKDVKIIDPDLISERYKLEGFSDYKDIGNVRFQDITQKALFSGEDFAIELNLGFQSHYDYLKSLHNVNRDNRIALVLFYTDHLHLCLTRAALRHRHGLHLVPPETIREMYDQTFPLLERHFSLIDQITFVHVSDAENPVVCAQFDNKAKELTTTNTYPAWFEHQAMAILNPLKGK